MSAYRIPHHTAVPPPRNAGRTDDPLRPRVRLVDSATAFVGILLILALATVSALTVIAAAPAGIAIPTAMLLIGGLIAGSLAMRRRADIERAYARAPRTTPVDDGNPTRERRGRSARQDRAMLLRAGRGESWRS
jgi:hypothetical protein